MTHLMHLMLSIAVVTLSSGCAADIHPSSTDNLYESFEIASPQGYPRNWYIEAQPEAASVQVSTTHARHKARALEINSDNQSPVFAYTPLGDGESCLTGVTATAEARIESSGGRLALFLLESGKAPETGEWLRAGKKKWMSLSASRSGTRNCSRDLMLGVLANGPIRAFVDKINVTLTSGVLADKAQPTEKLDARERDALTAQALLLNQPLDMPGDVMRAQLEQWLSGARVVGLGENSHGARALFQLKHSVMRVLVEDLGFTALAIEMPAQWEDIVNAYVLGESDDAQRALLALRYPAWQSEEMWRNIQWLREHNQSASTPVRVFGLDGPDPDGKTVDEGMAQRAEGIMQTMHASQKLMIWADNTHVSRAGQAMGALLHERLGEGYMALGLSFGRGHYSAYGPLKRYTASPAYAGTHEYLMAQIAAEAYIFRPAALPATHPLRLRLGFRYLGSRPQPFHQFYPHRLDAHFDLVGFVKRSDSTTYLLDHNF